MKIIFQATVKTFRLFMKEIKSKNKLGLKVYINDAPKFEFIPEELLNDFVAGLSRKVIILYNDKREKNRAVKYVKSNKL